MKYYIRGTWEHRTVYYDISPNGACHGLEGRASIFAVRSYESAADAERDALRVGLAESEFEIVEAS